MPINAATIFSTLGNSNSLVPLGVKDLAGTAGMTAGSYMTGKEEGFDRFIDEAGTEVIWLFGIPFFKWVYNSSVFKALGLESKYDPRNLKDSKIFEKTKEFAPNEEVKKQIEKIGRKQGLFKNTVSTRFVFSTLATIASYVMLTKFKQKYTEKQIKQNLIKEYNEKKQQESDLQKRDSEGIEPVNPTFKGIGPMVEQFAFSPVKNMYILEGAITTTRLKDSRNPQEFVGYGIKEAATLTFLYYAGPKIQKVLESYAKKHFNKSIDLDARVLESDSLKKVFEDGSIEKSLQAFKEASTSDTDLYEFIHNNPENFTVSAAKRTSAKGSGNLIEMYKNTNKIDTRAYIDLDDVRGVNNKLEELYNQYKKALANGETSDKFFAQVKNLKRKSVIANIGASCLALGVITPAIMLGKRLLSKDDTEFHTKKEIRKQLIEDGIIA